MKFERGAPFSGDYASALAALHDRLGLAQLAQIVHRRRAIVLVEGWEGAGKKEALKCLAAAWDPCQLTTHCVGTQAHADDDRHWLARFWGALPAAGNTAIFFHSWYRQVVEARMAGALDDKAFSRATDEINEFEAQQRDHGTLLIKLFFHLPADVQGERLRIRREDPWRRALVGTGDVKSHADRTAHEAAWQQLFDQTDTRWAPWRLIDASDERGGRLAALAAIADAYKKAMPSDPPAQGDTVVYMSEQRRG